MFPDLPVSAALFFDFDGTLVDIADHPEQVTVPAPLVAGLGALREIHGGALALVSGRPLESLDRFLSPATFTAAGVHGLERRRADGSRDDVNATDILSALSALEAAIHPLTQADPRLLLERKTGSLAVHYRQAPALEGRLREAIEARIGREPALTLLEGKCVFEVKPAQTDKGAAIEAFLSEAPFAGRQPVFLGDDVTDEAGFDVVNARGGLSIKVGEGVTRARHRVETPAIVRAWIARLTEESDRP
ncbi:MAG: trehalose-phosphatase [Pseudomonadota bacterium]